MKFTQHQKIIGLMVRRRDTQEWFFAYDFMPPRLSLDYIYCVGYEASARFTELANLYPDMIETLPAGKYKKRRIRFETIEGWIGALPKDLRYMFHRGGLSPEKRQQNQPAPISKIVKGQKVGLRGFGEADGQYKVKNVQQNSITIAPVKPPEQQSLLDVVPNKPERQMF